MFILTGGMLSLCACGQKGNLYLPTDPAAAQRASLPQAVQNSARAALPLPVASDKALPDASMTPSGND